MRRNFIVILLRPSATRILEFLTQQVTPGIERNDLVTHVAGWVDRFETA